MAFEVALLQMGSTFCTRSCDRKRCDRTQQNLSCFAQTRKALIEGTEEAAVCLSQQDNGNPTLAQAEKSDTRVVEQGAALLSLESVRWVTLGLGPFHGTAKLRNFSRHVAQANMSCIRC